MIRPATFVCATLAFASGLYLYQSKHGAQLLDREIARTVKDTGTANERINILKAEYQLLNEPERLQGLAQQYLSTRPMAPAQTVALADLGARLPAALPASAFAPPAEEPAAAAPVAPPPVQATAIFATVSQPPRPPARPVSAPVAPTPATAIVTAAATPLPPRPVAEAPAPRPVLRRMPEVPSLIIGPAVAAPLAPVVPLTSRPVLVQRVVASMPASPIVTAAVAPVAFPSGPPMIASSLGVASHAALLPPPVPVR